MSKVLVTGATGFIGNHVVLRLRDDGHQVFALGGRRASADGAAWDLGDSEARPDESVPFTECDCVVHAAGLIPSHLRKTTDPEYDAVNAQGTLRLLRAVFASGGRNEPRRRIIYVSTTSVYGHAAKITDESTAPCPGDAYAASKLGGEMYTSALATLHGADHVILRPSYVYGAGTAEPNVLQRLAGAVASGDTVRLVRGGRDRFDFVHVDDVARAVAAALQRGAGVYNVVTGRATSIHQLVLTLGRALGRDPVIDLAGEEEEAGHCEKFSAARAVQELGFKAETPLAAGVRECMP